MHAINPTCFYERQYLNVYISNYDIKKLLWYRIIIIIIKLPFV